MRPINIRIRIITKTVPNPPVGPYPQFLLCGHVGKAPIRNKIKITRMMVVSDICNFFQNDKKLPLPTLADTFGSLWNEERG